MTKKAAPQTDYLTTIEAIWTETQKDWLPPPDTDDSQVQRLIAQAEAHPNGRRRGMESLLVAVAAMARADMDAADRYGLDIASDWPVQLLRGLLERIEYLED